MMSTPNVAGFQNRLRWNVTNPPKGPHQHSSCVALCTAQNGETALDHAMRIVEDADSDDELDERGKKMAAIVALLRQYQKEEA